MADGNDKSGQGGPPYDDPRFQGSMKEIIAAFSPEANKGMGAKVATNDTNTETNSNSGNGDGAEMGRGRGVAVEQGSPGPLVTAAVGQEPKISDPPQKEPASNVPPDVKEQAAAITKDIATVGVKANGPEDGNLSSKINAATGNHRQAAGNEPDKGNSR